MIDRRPSLEDYATYDESQYPALWGGCVGAWAPMITFGMKSIPDLSVFKNPAAFQNTLFGSEWSINNGMPGYAFNLASSQCATIADKSYLQFDTGNFTAFVRFVIFTFPNNNTISRMLISKGSFGFEIAGYNNTGPSANSGWIVAVLNGNSIPAAITTNWYTISTNKLYSAYLTRNGSTAILGVDKNTTSVSNGSTVSNASVNVSIGRRTGAANYLNGFVAESFLFNRALSLDELFFMSDNPGAMFLPRRRKINRSYSIPSSFSPAWARNSNIILPGVSAC